MMVFFRPSVVNRPTTILGMDQPRPSYLSLMQHGGGSGGSIRATRAMLLNEIHWMLTYESYLSVKSTSISKCCGTPNILGVRTERGVISSRLKPTIRTQQYLSSLLIRSDCISQ